MTVGAKQNKSKQGTLLVTVIKGRNEYMVSLMDQIKCTVSHGEGYPGRDTRLKRINHLCYSTDQSRTFYKNQAISKDINEDVLGKDSTSRRE